MTSITKNLPWFVRDLGVSIIGEKCYSSLIENLDVSDMPCIEYSISKGLGLGIIAGGSIMKVPQILLILNSRSAEGLSLPGYILETLSYAITLGYSVAHKFPFSTYGENAFLTFQNLVITLLIVSFSKAKSSPSTLLLALVLLSTLSALPLMDKEMLSPLQLATLPLSLASKIPQITSNYSAKSTGQLSTIAVLAQILGCVARLFTTMTEVKDLKVAAGFVGALVLNLILGVQVWMYHGQAPVLAHKEKTAIANGKRPVAVDEREVKVEEKVAVSVPAYEPAYEVAPRQQNHTVHRVATPPPQSPASGGRKWARKVD